MDPLEQKIIDDILEREGWPAYTHAPADRGGPTKGGITLTAWREFTRNPSATAAELATITEDQARAFYRHRHIVAPRFHEIREDYLRELVIDCGVHHGVWLASTWLQRAAALAPDEQDGRVGPITLAAVNAADPRELFLWIVAYRIRLFGKLIGQDPELARARRAGFELQAQWAGGWNNRAAEFVEGLARRLEQQHRAR